MCTQSLITKLDENAHNWIDVLMSHYNTFSPIFLCTPFYQKCSELYAQAQRGDKSCLIQCPVGPYPGEWNSLVWHHVNSLITWVKKKNFLGQTCSPSQIIISFDSESWPQTQSATCYLGFPRYNEQQVPQLKTIGSSGIWTHALTDWCLKPAP